MPLAPALPTTAVDRLPRGEFGVDELDADPYWRLVAAFLVECRRQQTRRAYFTGLKTWYAWCVARDLHPLAARRHDVALWAPPPRRATPGLRQSPPRRQHRPAPTGDQGRSNSPRLTPPTKARHSAGV
jgi:hypothetical protein